MQGTLILILKEWEAMEEFQALGWHDHISILEPVKRNWELQKKKKVGSNPDLAIY